MVQDRREQKALELVGTIARMLKDGETEPGIEADDLPQSGDIDGPEGFIMENDDAWETMHRLIGEAREIMSMEPTAPVSPERELTDADIAELDRLDNLVHQALCHIAGREIAWDMEKIGPVRDAIAEALNLEVPTTQLTPQQIYVQNCGGKCPFCDSENIEGVSSIQADSDYAWQDVQCNACEKSWQDLYALVGFDTTFKEDGGDHESANQRAIS